MITGMEAFVVVDDVDGEEMSFVVAVGRDMSSTSTVVLARESRKSVMPKSRVWHCILSWLMFGIVSYRG